MPTTIVDAIEHNTDSRCHSTRCASHGCSLQMAGVPLPYVLIDLENRFSPANKTRPHCDYLFVGGADEEDQGPWLVPLELGRKKPRVLLDQLRGGSSIAAGLLPRAVRVRFKPVFAHVGGLHRRDFDTLRKDASKISFGSTKVLVTTVRCGGSLANALTR